MPKTEEEIEAELAREAGGRTVAELVQDLMDGNKEAWLTANIAGGPALTNALVALHLACDGDLDKLAECYSRADDVAGEVLKRWDQGDN